MPSPSQTSLTTIAELKRTSSREQSPVEACIHAQVEARIEKQTQNAKPYWEMAFADSEGRFTLRAWSDSAAFMQCGEIAIDEFCEIRGAFTASAFGLDSKNWTLRLLANDERDALLAGPPALREKQERDYEFIEKCALAISDPRLHALAARFLAEHGERFRRTAAARHYHHARRGGLVEHVAQMMRSANALADVYPQLNRDLLITGVLFHDCGKLWENALPENGFTMAFSETGELLGHITIGAELVNYLWRELLASEAAADWSKLEPKSEEVRLHLLHLIVAHHGEQQFGSPVVPKTPEAQALHYIDNLDAKLEMMADCYASSAPLSNRIFERKRPLPGNLAKQLEVFEQIEPSETEPAAESAPDEKE